jgi:hypothetical protein
MHALINRTKRSAYRMQTRIIIDHADGDALRSSPLWPLIQSLLWADGPVQIVEIGRVEPEDEVGRVEPRGSGSV